MESNGLFHMKHLIYITNFCSYSIYKISVKNYFSHFLDKVVPYLTEAKLLNIISKCKSEGSFSLLIRTLGEVFSSSQALSRSFQKSSEQNFSFTAILDRVPSSLLCPFGDFSKEAVRSLQGEDKEEDSSDPPLVEPQLCDTIVDLPSVRRAFNALWSLPGIR